MYELSNQEVSFHLKEYAQVHRVRAYKQFHKNVYNFVTVMNKMKIFNFKHSYKEIHYT